MDLMFGKKMNNNRQKIKNNILKKSKIENFENFNENLDKSTRLGNTFYEQYNKIKNNVIKCKAKCKTTYSYVPNENDSPSNAATAATNARNKLTACNVGCELKGPYYKACEDTYKGHKNDITKKCNDLISDKCLGGKIHNDGNAVLSHTNADYLGVTLKHGCCACGGGRYGPPAANIGGQYLFNCDQLPEVMQISGSVGDELKNICKDNNNDMMPEQDKKLSEDLLKNYKNYDDVNNTLDNTIKSLFDKLLDLKNYNSKIDNALSNMNINELTNYYEHTYEKLKKTKSKNIHTLNGQLDEIMQRTSTSSTKYTLYIFLIFILLSLIAIFKSLNISITSILQNIFL